MGIYDIMHKRWVKLLLSIVHSYQFEILTDTFSGNFSVYIAKDFITNDGLSKCTHNFIKYSNPNFAEPKIPQITMNEYHRTIL